MSEQALDLRRSVKIVRRHKILVGVFAVLGLLAGAGYAATHPPMISSNALVVISPSARDVPTQVIIATSNPVLSHALHRIGPPMSLEDLHSHIQVKRPTSNILSITAQATTAAQAERAANAVADSYIAYTGSSSSPAGKVQAQLLQLATKATGTGLPSRLILTGVLGALIGGLIGAIAALALHRGDRRLRERDEIANALGVPVLASIPVDHPSDASRWARLLEDYKPNVMHAWQLRTALGYLGQVDGISTNGDSGDGFSVTVLSLSSDQGALALGPQLAVFAASLGIPTALVIGPQQDPNAAAALRAACSKPPPSSRRSSQLMVTVADHGDRARQPGARLTVIVGVVDGRAPIVADTLRANTTLLGVSAGRVTAAQLVGVAVSAGTDGRQIDGILVADPDPADQTTGRVPQLTRPPQRRMPSRLTSKTTEIRR
jgi:capsular polysaccharide biosynthesis protein